MKQNANMILGKFNLYGLAIAQKQVTPASKPDFHPFSGTQSCEYGQSSAPSLTVQIHST